MTRQRHPQGFIIAPRGESGLELIRTNSNAFNLLYIIAMRARWQDGFNQHGLGPGQAFIGDWRNCGMTQRGYRTAKRRLEAAQLVTFQATNRGTIATIINTDIFDLNLDAPDDQNDGQPTSRRRAGDEQATTNQQGNKETREEAAAGNPKSAQFDHPTIAEATTYAEEIGLPAWKAQEWFNAMEAGGWLDSRHRPIANWKAFLGAVLERWKADGSSPIKPARFRNGHRSMKPANGPF